MCLSFSPYTVTDAEGRLTPVAKVAHDICNLNLPVVDHVIIHIAKQQRNYHTQQAMILADMFNRKNNRATLQVGHPSGRSPYTLILLYLILVHFL